MIRTTLISAILLMISSFASAQDGLTTYGWRGNLTGLYPDAQVPSQWCNISTGPMQTAKCTTTQPADGGDKDAVPIEKGLVTQWLVIGPFQVQDGEKDFDKEMIANEAEMAPSNGQKEGDLEWHFAQPISDGVSFWGVSIAGPKGEKNQVGYATTCLYAAKPGKVRAVFEHATGMKMYVNGKEVYREPQQRAVVGSAYALGRNRIASTHPVAPSVEFDLKAGWNRLTVKLVAPNKSQWNALNFYMRLSDAEGTKYERKNIAWIAPLPDRSNATPIIVGDKIFIMAEPDELLCMDKKTGKVLWNALHNYFEATPQEQRDANPAFNEKVEPLAKLAREEKDVVKRAQARKKMQDALEEIDKKQYKMDLDGHLLGHLEIVGFTTTPCSDGKYVYVWCGNGVAACYDLDGRRQWIRRFQDKLFYSASPALIDGTFAVYFRQLYGLDAKTGEIRWQQPEVNQSIASLLGVRLAGTPVIVSQPGEIVRASDGRMLWKNPHKTPSQVGWCAPVVISDVMYLPWIGIASLYVEDFSGCSGDEWKPKETLISEITKGVGRKPGDQGDPWMAASPLVHEGLLYGIDIHSEYYVIDLKAGKRVGRRFLDFRGDNNYVAFKVAASPTLVGKYIVVMDNQGRSITLEPGPECKIISQNTLATQLQRDWPITTVDYTSYSPPVPDGKRMYLRGERVLYCIGAE